MDTKRIKKYLKNRKGFKIPESAFISDEDVSSPKNIGAHKHLGDDDKIGNMDLYCYIEENTDEGKKNAHIDWFEFKLKDTISYGFLLQKYRTGKLISLDGERITPISTSENLCIFESEFSKDPLNAYKKCRGGQLFTKDYTQDLIIYVGAEGEYKMEICPYWDGVYAEKAIMNAVKGFIADYITSHPDETKNPKRFKVLAEAESAYCPHLLKFGTGFSWIAGIHRHIEIHFDDEIESDSEIETDL